MPGEFTYWSFMYEYCEKHRDDDQFYNDTLLATKLLLRGKIEEF